MLPRDDISYRSRMGSLNGKLSKIPFPRQLPRHLSSLTDLYLWLIGTRYPWKNLSKWSPKKQDCSQHVTLLGTHIILYPSLKMIFLSFPGTGKRWTKVPWKKVSPLVLFCPILKGELRMKNKICWVKLSDDPFGWPLLLNNPPNNRGHCITNPNNAL